MSGAQKRKKKREKEEAMKEAVSGYGAVKAWTDQGMDGIGVASQGCVRLARDSEIEWDRSVFLFKGEWRELGCACVRRGKRIGITLGSIRMFIDFDAGIGVE